jgi:hypothetical protein
MQSRPCNPLDQTPSPGVYVYDEPLKIGKLSSHFLGQKSRENKIKNPPVTHITEFPSTSFIFEAVGRINNKKITKKWRKKFSVFFLL